MKVGQSVDLFFCSEAMFITIYLITRNFCNRSEDTFKLKTIFDVSKFKNKTVLMWKSIEVFYIHYIDSLIRAVHVAHR